MSLAGMNAAAGRYQLQRTSTHTSSSNITSNDLAYSRANIYHYTALRRSTYTPSYHAPGYLRPQLGTLPTEFPASAWCLNMLPSFSPGSTANKPLNAPNFPVNPV